MPDFSNLIPENLEITVHLGKDVWIALGVAYVTFLGYWKWLTTG